jgi:hypothetical protein
MAMLVSLEKKMHTIHPEGFDPMTFKYKVIHA